MTTARDLINSALVDIRVKANGQTLAASHLSDGLDTLNEIIDAWASENLMIYGSSEEVFSLVSGQRIYSIGTSGTPDFDTERPTSIMLGGWFIRDGDSDYPVHHMSVEQYRRIFTKGITGRPYIFTYLPTYPNGEIKLYYTPDSNYSLYMRTVKPLSGLSALSTTFSFPPGYQRALRKALAVELAEGYGKNVTQTLYMAAKESKQVIKRTNAQRVEPVMLEVSSLSGRSRRLRNVQYY